VTLADFRAKFRPTGTGIVERSTTRFLGAMLTLDALFVIISSNIWSTLSQKKSEVAASTGTGAVSVQSDGCGSNMIERV
jgi:hypothetical protein